MKKLFLLLSVLIISVITTACSNNFAVQELNNKAQGFMNEGDYQNAIERLKSSIDLDPSIFESHYNLAVAYTKAEDYANAIKVYNDAIKLKPDFADTYYSLAVCEENLASDLINTFVHIDESGNIVKTAQTDENSMIQEQQASEQDKNYALELLKSAVTHYQTYLEKAPDAKDIETVNSKIELLNQKIEEYSAQEIQ